MMARQGGILAGVALLGAMQLASLSTRAAETVYPTADGTLVDGGVFGSRDGVVDRWTWEFDSTRASGAVSLATETPESAVEHRVVFEYDLRTVGLVPPVEATLTVTTRGVSVFPFPEVTVHVYAYPADLIESPGDFSAGPAVFVGAVTVGAMQAPTTAVLDVSEVVSTVLAGTKMAAFRFQIDPATPHVANQAFLDALDTEPMTKPLLTIHSALPADADGDGDADLDDFAILVDCLAGSGSPPAPTIPGVTAADCTWAFDHDGDTDVDLEDLSNLLGAFIPE